MTQCIVESHSARKRLLSPVLQLIDTLQQSATRSQPLAASNDKLMEEIDGTSLYQRLLHSLTGRQFSREDAGHTWDRILDHRYQLQQTLERDPGFFVAALDYFENYRSDRNIHYAFIEEGQLSDLVEQSALDGMTMLYNHKTFLTLLEKEMALAKRKQTPLSLIMADIDDFKCINDDYGHQIGDQVLTRTAMIFTENLRAMDIAGRYGGEEFIVALPATPEKSAREIAERIRKKIETEFGYERKITISMGLSCFPNTASNLEALIQEADRAMYRAKQCGKNQLHCAPS